MSATKSVTIDVQLKNAPALPSNVTADLFTQAFEKLKELVGDKKFSMGTIVELVGLAVQIVENLVDADGNKFPGVSKKTLVIHIISKFVNEVVDYWTDDEKSGILNVFIPIILEGLIDGLVSLGVDQLGPHLDTIKNWCAKCSCGGGCCDACDGCECCGGGCGGGCGCMKLPQKCCCLL